MRTWSTYSYFSNFELFLINNASTLEHGTDVRQKLSFYISSVAAFVQRISCNETVLGVCGLTSFVTILFTKTLYVERRRSKESNLVEQDRKFRLLYWRALSITDKESNTGGFCASKQIAKALLCGHKKWMQISLFK